MTAALYNFYGFMVIFKMSIDDWRKLNPRRFEELFQGSAVKRAKYEGLMRNIRFLNR